jgi:hypothetical protein
VLPAGATVSGCQVLVPLTAKNRSRFPDPAAAMFTLLPSVVIDGAEYVEFTPATVSACHLDDPFTGSQTRPQAERGKKT